MDNHKEVIGYVTSGIANAAYVISQTPAEQVMQIVTLGIGLLSGVLSIAYTVYKWYKRATSPTSNGGEKITFDEMKEGFKEITEVIDNVNKD